MKNEPPISSALVSELGWGETDPAFAWGGPASALLVVVTGLYYAMCLWVASGLPPLPRVGVHWTRARRESQLHRDA
jgi:hypothetical protein